MMGGGREGKQGGLKRETKGAWLKGKGRKGGGEEKWEEKE